ncbi:hypothetical protein C0Q70_12468 [Pomacea canaliculata]|uniref:Uncharacterized protein n=1 Tax=Pomacea canaliculata TaxID=400727 RepID=A0A2T7P1L2_POMCA|nr:uncharacterized protein LOC112569228 [Pomacea canaliculata]PVD27312.1 hypothetical protein C0Q70_12468 [Pomacea canaliculata]
MSQTETFQESYKTSVDNEDITIVLTLIATIVAVIAISSTFIIWCCPGCVENSTHVVMEIIRSNRCRESEEERESSAGSFQSRDTCRDEEDACLTNDGNCFQLLNNGSVEDGTFDCMESEDTDTVAMTDTTTVPPDPLLPQQILQAPVFSSLVLEDRVSQLLELSEPPPPLPPPHFI